MTKFVFIEREIRTLPSGRQFQRNRCKVCKCYWDTNHKLHKDEKEIHERGCPVTKMP